MRMQISRAAIQHQLRDQNHLVCQPARHDQEQLGPSFEHETQGFYCKPMHSIGPGFQIRSLKYLDHDYLCIVLPERNHHIPGCKMHFTFPLCFFSSSALALPRTKICPATGRPRSDRSSQSCCRSTCCSVWLKKTNQDII